MKTQRQQTDYLTIKQVALEIADLVPAKTPELLAQKVYGHIRRGHLKGIKGRLAQADGSVRLVTVAHRNDVEVYKAWLKSEERSCIDIPTPALSVPSGDLRTIDLLRSIAVDTLGKYLSTLPKSDREDVGVAVVVEAIA